ncbi:rod shape-determining protein MreD [Alicyclobacillus pomorum]|jgi:rod shape-determining protein MreD|uniref:rod shape-determining protein MreD n=1 Tax=Alicyclobacillus pomorum TaxID=204470 RepID=UPI000417FE19|nr:rod shape-determining protein MreD [Alicyclobacillus pomorum]
MKNAISFFLMWLGLIIQSTFFQVPPINVLQPNLVLVVLVMVALTRGAKAALILGVAIGFIQDVDYGSFLGLNAFTYGVIGYFAAASFAQFLHKNVALTLLVTVVCTFAQDWITYGMTRLFEITAYSWHAVLSFTLEQMVINGISLLLLYPLLLRWLMDKARNRYSHSESDPV